jgi:DNA-binding response OmpR family regulator
MSDAEDPPSPSPPPRVLLVEDDAELAARLVASLHAQGFTADVVADGGAALGRVRTDPFDVVVVGMVLPVASGFRVVQELRAARGADVPVVMTSTFAATEHQDYARLIGVDWFLAKPFTDTELLAILQAVQPAP